MNKQFWKAALIRAVRTFFQTFVGLIASSAMLLSDVKWVEALSASALAFILSICTSIGTGLPEVGDAE